MKLTTEFTNLEKSAVKLTVTIAKKDVQESYNSIVAKYVKSAQIPGFRKGHVPANVLERKYGDAIKADALSEIIDKSLNEIFEKETENRPLPYQQPVMDQVPEFDVSKDLTYTVTFDVFPKVEVKDFAGIEVKEPQVSVGDKELEDELKAIQERNAVVMDKKADETAEKDNIVTVDYKEENGENRNGYVFTVGSADDIYKISDDVIGMKKDETKEVSKDDKKITLTVKAIKTRQLPALDDDLAQDVSEKFKTLDDLKADIKRNLEVAKTRNSIVSSLNSIFTGFSEIDDDFYEELEEILIMSDIGVNTTEEILDNLKEQVKELKIKEPIECKELLIKNIEELAKKEGRSFNNLVIYILKEYMKSHK